MIILLQTLG